MKKLIGFELYKIIVNKFFVFTTIILLIANLLTCFLSLDNTHSRKFNTEVNSFFEIYNENPDILKKYYSEYLLFNENQLKILEEAIMNGDFTYEIKELPNRYASDKYTDEQFFEILFSAIDFEESYKSKINTILDEARDRLNEYLYLGISPTTFSYRLQTEIISEYEPLKRSLSFPISYTYGWDSYFNYTAINIFIFITLSISGVIVFTQDSSSGFRLLANTTKNGKRKYIMAKISSICIICFFVVLIFSLTTLILLNFAVGFSSSSIHIQMIDGFVLCPFQISVNEYLVISFLFRVFSFTVLLLLIVTISVFIQNTLLAFLSSILVLGSQIVLHSFTEFISTGYFKVLDFISSIDVNDYFNEYRAVNFFGRPVDFLLFSSVTYIILLLGFVLIISAKHCSHYLPSIQLSISSKLQHIKRRDSDSIKSTKITHEFSTSCFMVELYKILISSRFIILIVVLLVGKLFLSFYAIPSSETYDEIIYKNYVCSVSGPFSESSEKFINDERSYIDKILSQQTEMQQLFLYNEITYSEYRDYLSAYSEAYSENKALSFVEKYMQYIKEQQSSGYDAWFVYDSGWNLLFLNDADWTQYIALILLFSSIFASEFVHTSSSQSFASILRTTRFGRERTFICKYLVAGIMTVIISILWNVIDFIVISSRFELDLFSAPLHSLTIFSDYNLNFSIGNYLVYYYLLKILSSLTLSSVICSVSAVLQKTLPAVTLISLILLLPSALSFCGITYLDDMDFITFLRVTPLLLKNSFAYFYIIFNLLLCFFLYKCAQNKWNHLFLLRKNKFLFINRSGKHIYSN